MVEGTRAKILHNGEFNRSHQSAAGPEAALLEERLGAGAAEPGAELLKEIPSVTINPAQRFRDQITTGWNGP